MATSPRPILETTFFFEQLAEAPRSALLLEFESTIARLGAADPRFPYPTARELLECIAMTTRTRVMVASGMPAREVCCWLPAGAELCSREIGGRLVSQLVQDGPLACLTGARHTLTPVGGRTRLWVRPEYHLRHGQRVLGPAEELVQFLADWLRACAGEVC